MKAQITFLGEANSVPHIGQQVQLHAADGSWQHGFRCISTPIRGQVWVCREEEWQSAKRQGRRPKGDKWPLQALAAVEGTV